MHKPLSYGFLLMSFLCGEVLANGSPLGIDRKTHGESIANDMNPAGQVAAVIKDADGTSHGIFFEKGKLIKLESAGESASEANRINNQGDIVGSVRKGYVWRAMLSHQGKDNHELGTLGGENSHGMALNNHGQAVGFSDLADDSWHAFLYTPGEGMKDLGTLGGRISYAVAINDAAQVVGTAMDSEGYRHAFLYTPDKGMRDLGTLGGRFSYASSINRQGMVAGASEMKDRRIHAFVYDGKQMVDLGAKIGYGNSFATGINDEGHVVGVVDLEDIRLLFVWRDNKMILHPSGKSLYLTNAINNAGQVIGAIYDRGLEAATMPSNASPFVDHGGDKIFGFNLVMILLAATAVLLRKRFKGLFFNLSPYLRQKY